MIDDPKSKDGIQVSARAAAVMRALKDSQTGPSLGQIAERVALPRSTVQRIVAALIDARLLIATRGAGVRLGPRRMGRPWRLGQSAPAASLSGLGTKTGFRRG